MRRNPAGRFASYLALIIGAIVFSFPFVWMVGTSFKVDGELFSRDLRVLPQQPLPRTRSPYYEDRRLEPLPDYPAGLNALLPGIEALVRERFPAIDAADVPTLARTAFGSLASRAPASVWAGPPDGLLAFARTDLTAERLTELAGTIRRELRLGPVRARSLDLMDVELLRDKRPSQRWTEVTPQIVRLEDGEDSGLPFTRVAYDLGADGGYTLSTRAALPFPGEKLQRLQLRVQPDDTWHDLSLEVEVAGRRYRAERTAPLANAEWTTLTLQFPPPPGADESTRKKTWLVLLDDGSSDLPAGEVRLRLKVERAGHVRAGYNKLIANYQRVFDQVPLARYLRVSLFLVVANIVLTLLASSLVAYGVARITWPGREFCFLLLLATMMIPGQVTMIPHFLIWKSLGVYNTLTPLFAGSALGNAFFIFLLRQFMKGIPRDLEDAARIDGCNFLRIYWHVIVPLIKPSLAAIAIFTFLGTWNDFIGPMLYIADQRLYPLAFGLYAFSVQVNANPTLTMAASVLMTGPVILLFFVAQRYFIQGVTLTGIKG